MAEGRDETIVVRGARVHNLRNIDVEIPRDRLVVLTGVSGSGKSSLAFDTLFAEAQRRYIETLSSYARQYLDQLEPPDVDLIDGLPPTVAIEQKAGTASPRSTVGTLTEIHDSLRLLFARCGVPHCPECGLPIQRQTPEQMAAGVLTLPAGRKVVLLAPLVRGRKGEHLDAFAAIRRAGLIRARIDGEIQEVLDEPPRLARMKNHDIEAVVDRLVVRDGIRPRLAESIDRAIQLGEGTVILTIQGDDGTWSDRVLSIHLACPGCGVGLEAIEPRSFSFNSPYGACTVCDGLGTVTSFGPALVLSNPEQPLGEGAIALFSVLPPALRDQLVNGGDLDAFLKRSRVRRGMPLSRWSAKARETLLRGKPDDPTWRVGLLERLEALYSQARNERLRARLDAFRAHSPCPACAGTRLRPAARAVRLAGRTLPELLALAVDQAARFCAGITFEPPLDQVGPPILKEVTGRLAFLERVGVGYLTLDRPADTLSGGEHQRVRLATQVGSGLVGVCFVVDEPTTGLHPRDTARLLETLSHLRDAGNTVVVVEHDEAMIRSAEWVIDLGPGAGPDGGRVVAEGPPTSLQGDDSITARWLRGELRLETSSGTRRSPGAAAIEIQGASEHNLRLIDVRIPLGSLVCVTGVSGSGKTTLVFDILGRAAHRHLFKTGPAPGAQRHIGGLDQIDKLVIVDQAPIGRTPRSTPATFTGVYDEIRKVFALTREAKIRGFRPSRFSFNAKGGRCEGCQGQGQRRVEMQFLPDLFVTCETCGGRRFNPPTLEVRYKSKSIADVLAMRVDEAVGFFGSVPRVLRGLEALHEAGLGYVTLGQSSTTLSGGEAQRVKLAAELGKSSAGRGLYLLDEPTTGLHAADVANLMRVLNRLADLGNTLVVIEHNLDLIRASDWIIDLGPEGGIDGGELLAMGTPEEVACNPASITGSYLARPSIALSTTKPARQSGAR